MGFVCTPTSCVNKVVHVHKTEQTDIMQIDIVFTKNVPILQFSQLFRRQHTDTELSDLVLHMIVKHRSTT